MAFDQLLADRISVLLKEKGVYFTEKKMFGGLSFMVDEKMCVGIIKNDLMVRIDPEIQEVALQKEGARMMDFTGRPMKGYLNVGAEGYDMDTDLEYWVDLCLEFNPKAKSSKRKE